MAGMLGAVMNAGSRDQKVSDNDLKLGASLGALVGGFGAGVSYGQLSQETGIKAINNGPRNLIYFKPDETTNPSEGLKVKLY
jgi:cobalamin biosynthesis protein CbiD